jgi:hypothetical protein
MTVLVDAYKTLHGEMMASVIHMHAQYGDPLKFELSWGLCLRQVYSPLFEVFHMYEHSMKLFLVDKLCALLQLHTSLTR